MVPGGMNPTITPPIVMGTAGSGALPMPMATTPPVMQNPGPTPPQQTPPVQQPPPTMMPPVVEPPPPAAGNGLAMDECKLDTKWPGDEYCINAPPPDKGFQMHIGPSNYDNPEPRYVMEPDSEITESFSGMSTNTTQVYYYWRQYRMRPGSHHLIINAGTRRLGGTQNVAKDNPDRGMIAEENKGVGMMLAPRTQLSNSLHYYNFTEQPIIKEVWVNFWYRPANEVTEPANEIFSMLGMGIQPGQRVIKHGSCAVQQAGRILTMYGHVHSHNKRFSVWRQRGSEKMLVHESYDWEHPGVSEYSSVVMNPALNPMAKIGGGYSGILDVKPGDSIEFECDILNDTNSVFVGQNEAQDDEMCILIGDSVGTRLSPLCTPTDLPATNN
jgi:hypothetical protein